MRFLWLLILLTLEWVSPMKSLEIKQGSEQQRHLYQKKKPCPIDIGFPACLVSPADPKRIIDKW